jgi:hypothetical protein
VKGVESGVARKRSNDRDISSLAVYQRVYPAYEGLVAIQGKAATDGTGDEVYPDRLETQATSETAD